MTKPVSHDLIYDQLGLQDAALIIDVRDDQAMEKVPRMIPGALRLTGSEVHQWWRRLPRSRAAFIYCGAGGELSDTVAHSLASKGFAASVLTGGLETWIERMLPTVRVRHEYGVPGGSRWVTRERPKIDRLACPWLLRRFIDPQASFFYVPAHTVRAEGAALGAEPYDIPDVTFSHRGERCSFDAFLDEFDLHDPVLDTLAEIVRAADTGTLERSKEAPGLLAISLGLSATIGDDVALLEQGMVVYDALYAWCKTARDEVHAWPQKKSASL